MQSIKLHSRFTFLKKYILSIWILLIAGVFIFATIKSKNWIGLIFALLLANGIIYMIRKFLIILRQVFLDTESGKIYVKHNGKLIQIPENSVTKIELENRIGNIIIVKLNTSTKFGNEFSFTPKDSTVLDKLDILKDPNA